MSQLVKRTADFERCCKRNKIAESIVAKLETTLSEFNFQITNRSDRIYITSSGSASLWDVRMGNPAKGKGTSGGFRVLAYYVKDENTFYIDFISHKDDCAKGNGKKAYIQWENALKKMLKEGY